jgi:hypothetical protein
LGRPGRAGAWRRAARMIVLVRVGIAGPAR